MSEHDSSDDRAARPADSAGDHAPKRTGGYPRGKEASDRGGARGTSGGHSDQDRSRRQNRTGYGPAEGGYRGDRSNDRGDSRGERGGSSDRAGGRRSYQSTGRDGGGPPRRPGSREPRPASGRWSGPNDGATGGARSGGDRRSWDRDSDRSFGEGGAERRE